MAAVPEVPRSSLRTRLISTETSSEAVIEIPHYLSVFVADLYTKYAYTIRHVYRQTENKNELALEAVRAIRPQANEEFIDAQDIAEHLRKGNSPHINDLESIPFHRVQELANLEYLLFTQFRTLREHAITSIEDLAIAARTRPVIEIFQPDKVKEWKIVDKVLLVHTPTILPYQNHLIIKDSTHESVFFLTPVHKNAKWWKIDLATFDIPKAESIEKVPRYSLEIIPLPDPADQLAPRYTAGMPHMVNHRG